MSSCALNERGYDDTECYANPGDRCCTPLETCTSLDGAANGTCIDFAYCDGYTIPGTCLHGGSSIQCCLPPLPTARPSRSPSTSPALDNRENKTKNGTDADTNEGGNNASSAALMGGVAGGVIAGIVVTAAAVLGFRSRMMRRRDADDERREEVLVAGNPRFGWV